MSLTSSYILSFLAAVSSVQTERLLGHWKGEFPTSNESTIRVSLDLKKTNSGYEATYWDTSKLGPTCRGSAGDNNSGDIVMKLDCDKKIGTWAGKSLSLTLKDAKNLQTGQVNHNVEIKSSALGTVKNLDLVRVKNDAVFSNEKAYTGLSRLLLIATDTQGRFVGNMELDIRGDRSAQTSNVPRSILIDGKEFAFAGGGSNPVDDMGPHPASFRILGQKLVIDTKDDLNQIVQVVVNISAVAQQQIVKYSTLFTKQEQFMAMSTSLPATINGHKIMIRLSGTPQFAAPITNLE